jgi:hypothetical protein
MLIATRGNYVSGPFTLREDSRHLSTTERRAGNFSPFFFIRTARWQRYRSFFHRQLSV